VSLFAKFYKDFYPTIRVCRHEGKTKDGNGFKHHEEGRVFCLKLAGLWIHRFLQFFLFYIVTLTVEFALSLSVFFFGLTFG
jgi:hypothetical protein